MLRVMRVTETACDVFDNSKRIGGVVMMPEIKQWHATIEVTFGGPNDYTLMQGFGENPLEAVNDSVRKAIEHHANAIRACSRYVTAGLS